MAFRNNVLLGQRGIERPADDALMPNNTAFWLRFGIHHSSNRVLGAGQDVARYDVPRCRAWSAGKSAQC